MPDNSTTALVKTAQSPALARVSNQLALTDKLLAKKQPESDISTNITEEILVSPVRPNLPTKEEFNFLTKEEQYKVLSQLKNYNEEMAQYNAQVRVKNFHKMKDTQEKLVVLQFQLAEEESNLSQDSILRLNKAIKHRQVNLLRMEHQLLNNSLTRDLLSKLRSK